MPTRPETRWRREDDDFRWVSQIRWTTCHGVVHGVVRPESPALRSSCLVAALPGWRVLSSSSHAVCDGRLAEGAEGQRRKRQRWAALAS